MEYRAVRSRCAVILDRLKLPISNIEILKVLAEKGFEIVEVDICALAKSCIGLSQYRRGARLSEAPTVFDCSSFTKWIYGERGIWLPRRSIQQREFGESVNPERIIAGDLVFVSGSINYYHSDPGDGVGHVGIYVGGGKVVHADNHENNVIESPFDKFASETKFRGARRCIPRGAEVLTIKTPPHREVETSDDFRWIVLQSLPSDRQ